MRPAAKACGAIARNEIADSGALRVHIAVVSRIDSLPTDSGAQFYRLCSGSVGVDPEFS
jgi:hypothetical protein